MERNWRKADRKFPQRFGAELGVEREVDDFVRLRGRSEFLSKRENRADTRPREVGERKKIEANIIRGEGRRRSG